MAAFHRLKPSSSFLIIISVVIMASSTSKPRAMISAPNEMRWRSMPSMLIPTKVPASTSGIDSATTVPARRPKLRKLTASTMTTASTSDLMK